MLQPTAAAPAVRPLARSMLVPRSSPLSPGAIAGAVIGSVVGALLIAFCVFPFIVRARRRRLARHDDPGLAEMGQGPGGPIFPPQEDLDEALYKRSSGSGPETATTHDVPQTTNCDPEPQSALPEGVTVQHGLPSPVSSPASPIDTTAHGHGPSASPQTAAAPARSSAEAPSTSLQGSKGTVGRENTRELSFSDSYEPPSRELTNITSAGITEEPESFDRPSASPEHGNFPHLRGSLRSLLHGRRSSQHRRDSRRSTLGGSDGARSPSVTTNEPLSQAQPPPSGLEIDTETLGLAWDYYHDPNLGLELSETYPQSTQTHTSATTAPATYAPTSTGQVPVTGFGYAPTTRAVTQEPDVISPDSDTTLTPGTFSRKNTFLQDKRFSGPLQRTDSLPPPTIVADIPSPPLLQYNIGPSGNPMEMMKPTNPAENAWMLEHEMRMIQNFPPLPAPEPSLPSSMIVDAVSRPAPDNQPKPQFAAQYQPSYQSPYQSPPMAPSDIGMHLHEEPMEYYNFNVLTTPDYNTPPPSTGPSTQNTPDTRLTPYTASPSPPAEAEASINGHLTASPGLSAGPSPSVGLSPSPGLSSAPSPGRSPGPSQGRSPGRSPARPPGGFVCEVCGAVKSSYHQFNHHRRYHERPWPCKQCDRSFGTITHLKRHVNDKHHKTRKFYCTQPGCDYSRQGTKSFPRKDNWKRHMLKKHSIDPQNMTDEDDLGDFAMDEGDLP
ncbi:hypothetical protein N657DRAFT_336227 [Parathielavia appendiculata]|uniref:C2H2-type domain-containing protein n=1 Tax=Parathielavia appendiculata TaxID=2587402 RepID=A0AAN6U2P8_9PEZI|nr:hypothetical protein N657DRAFT_336227 [Parathielavia appendiculata]